MAATYKVQYFEARGGAETLRLTLSAAGQPFEDERLSRENWPKLKPSAPMKAMPMLTVTKDGKSTVYCQGGSCSRYVARKHGLVGSTPEEELLIDEVFEGVMDTQREMYKSYFESDEAKKKELEKKFADEALPKLADYVNLRKSKFGKDGYIIGNKLSLADIVVFAFVNGMNLMGKDMSKHTELIKHEALVKTNKNIAAWLAKRPKSDL